MLQPDFHGSSCKRSTWKSSACKFACFNALTLSPAEVATANKKGGGLLVSARQARLAKSVEQQAVDVIGLQECKLPQAQSGKARPYTTCYSAADKGLKGCGFWILSRLAQIRHIAVLHPDPTRLVLTVRSPYIAIDVMVLHGPVEGSADAEGWWNDSAGHARLLPDPAAALFFVDAIARPGSVASITVGDAHAEPESSNGSLVHAWMLQLRLCDFSTFRCRGPGGTWMSSTGHVRRIDYICGPQRLAALPFDIVVASELDVATVRDDHYSVILEIVWRAQVDQHWPSWHRPVMNRLCMKPGHCSD